MPFLCTFLLILIVASVRGISGSEQEIASVVEKIAKTHFPELYTEATFPTDEFAKSVVAAETKENRKNDSLVAKRIERRSMGFIILLLPRCRLDANVVAHVGKYEEDIKSILKEGIISFGTLIAKGKRGTLKHVEVISIELVFTLPIDYIGEFNGLEEDVWKIYGFNRPNLKIVDQICTKLANSVTSEDDKKIIMLDFTNTPQLETIKTQLKHLIPESPEKSGLKSIAIRKVHKRQYAKGRVVTEIDAFLIIVCILANETDLAVLEQKSIIAFLEKQNEQLSADKFCLEGNEIAEFLINHMPKQLQGGEKEAFGLRAFILPKENLPLVEYVKKQSETLKQRFEKLTIYNIQGFGFERKIDADGIQIVLVLIIQEQFFGQNWSLKDINSEAMGMVLLFPEQNITERVHGETDRDIEKVYAFNLKSALNSRLGKNVAISMFRQLKSPFRIGKLYELYTISYAEEYPKRTAVSAQHKWTIVRGHEAKSEPDPVLVDLRFQSDKPKTLETKSLEKTTQKPIEIATVPPPDIKVEPICPYNNLFADADGPTFGDKTVSNLTFSQLSSYKMDDIKMGIIYYISEIRKMGQLSVDESANKFADAEAKRRGRGLNAVAGYSIYTPRIFAPTETLKSAIIEAICMDQFSKPILSNAVDTPVGLDKMNQSLKDQTTFFAPASGAGVSWELSSGK